MNHLKKNLIQLKFFSFFRDYIIVDIFIDKLFDTSNDKPTKMF